EGASARYRADELPLETGEHALRIYLVGTEGWQQIASLDLRVRGEQPELALEPAINLEAGGDLSRSGAPDEPPEEDPIGEGRFALAGRWQRGAWELGLEADIVAASEVERALRFGERGEAAPEADLASYRLRAEHGSGTLEVGHTTFGTSRYLVDGFTSRGLRVEQRFGPRLDTELAVLNGTSIVGWSNPLGLARSRHQLRSARLGAELLSRAGGLRVDLTVLDGKRVPEDNFTGSSVNDTEENRGAAVSIRSESPDGRLRFEGGYASSRFDNPEDPTLALGEELVPVEEEDRDAYHAGLELELIRGRELGGHELDLGLRTTYERVEPLFRSVAASVLSDIERTAAERDLRYGDLALDLRHSRSEDNLDRIPSLLTTETRQSAASLRWAPSVWQREWLPVLIYSWTRIHQEGLGVPIDGGFSASHIPDQISVDRSASLEIQGSDWQAGYRFARTEQDNRQPGRLTDDFVTEIHTLFGSRPLGPRVDSTLELSRERFSSLGPSTVDATRRLGLALEWRPYPRLSFQLDASWTRLESDPSGSENEDQRADLQGTWRWLDRSSSHRQTSGTVYLRYSWNESDLLDPVFELRDFRSDRRLAAGLTFSWQ
ncbi:MAG: hypothetical protein MI919_03315, partial [Holophagales bacterium]|nr:hypothetical protein [Holophagales bacterium]